MPGRFMVPGAPGVVMGCTHTGHSLRGDNHPSHAPILGRRKLGDSHANLTMKVVVSMANSMDTLTRPTRKP